MKIYVPFVPLNTSLLHSGFFFCFIIPSSTLHFTNPYFSQLILVTNRCGMFSTDVVYRFVSEISEYAELLKPVSAI